MENLPKRLLILTPFITLTSPLIWGLGAEFIAPDFPCCALGEPYSCEFTLHWWNLPSNDSLHLYVAVMDADTDFFHSYHAIARGGYSPTETTVTCPYPPEGLITIPTYANLPIYFVVYWDDDYEPTEPDEILDAVELETCYVKVEESCTPHTITLRVSPNPFNEVILIRYDLPLDQNVSLKICDIMGHPVAALRNEHLSAGSHTTFWTPSDDIRNGVYLILLKTSAQTLIKRITLLR